MSGYDAWKTRTPDDCWDELDAECTACHGDGRCERCAGTGWQCEGEQCELCGGSGACECVQVQAVAA